MVRISSPAKLRPWSESTVKMVMGVIPGLVNYYVNNSQGNNSCDSNCNNVIVIDTFVQWDQRHMKKTCLSTILV